MNYSELITEQATYEGSQAIRAIRGAFDIIADQLSRASYEDQRAAALHRLSSLMGALSRKLYDKEQAQVVEELQKLDEEVGKLLEAWSSEVQ